MPIDDSTIVVGVTPRISAARFAEVLQTFGSPAASESDAEEAWSIVEHLGVDPAFGPLATGRRTGCGQERCPGEPD
jgi:hypothetical protein